jgi:hypothetical protein
VVGIILVSLLSKSVIKPKMVKQYFYELDVVRSSKIHYITKITDTDRLNVALAILDRSLGYSNLRNIPDDVLQDRITINGLNGKLSLSAETNRTWEIVEPVTHEMVEGCGKLALDLFPYCHPNGKLTITYKVSNKPSCVIC